jgi:cholesterol transport system auxiliary component
VTPAPRTRAPSTRRAALAVLSLSALGGCSGLFHSEAKPEQTYLLRAPSPAVPAAGAAAATDASASLPAAHPLGSLRVAHPLAAPGLDTPHIMLVQADHRMNFFLGSRWPAPLPDLIEALAVETLRASGDWQAVQDSDSAFPSEYLLQISVRRFEADYRTGGAAPEVQVVLDCSIGVRAGRELLASFVAQGSAAAGADRMSEVVAAFERASAAALSSLSQQAAAATRAAADRGPASR